MNRRTFLAGCSTLLGLAAPAFYGEPTKPNIARLIEQLGSKRFREREAAARTLEKIGEKALPGLLNAAGRHADGEVRRRAAVLVEALRKRLSGEVWALNAHAGRAQTVAFAANGRWVVSGSDDETIGLFDVLTGKEIKRFAMGEEVQHVAFSSDHKRVLAGSGRHTLSVWQVDSGEELYRWRWPSDASAIEPFAFSCDASRALSGHWDGTVRLWDVKRRKCLHVFDAGAIFKHGSKTGGGSVNCLAFSPDGKRFVYSTGQAVYCCRLTGPMQTRAFADQSLARQILWSVAFWPDGQSVLLGSSTGGIYRRLFESGRELQRFHVSKAHVATSVAVTPDQRWVVSGHDDGFVRVWDAGRMQQSRCMLHHQGAVLSVATSPSGQLALSGDDEGVIRLWRMPQ